MSGNPRFSGWIGSCGGFSFSMEMDLKEAALPNLVNHSTSCGFTADSTLLYEFAPASKDPRVTAVNVGQEIAIIRTPFGPAYLVDGGGDSVYWQARGEMSVGASYHIFATVG